MIEPRIFTLRPQPVPGPITAVQITEENIAEVAEWCGLRAGIVGGKPAITFEWVNSEITRDAFVGHWVIRSAEGKFTYMWEAQFRHTYMGVGER